MAIIRLSKISVNGGDINSLKEGKRMKRFKISLFAMLFTLSLVGSAQVEGANFITAYVTGKVISYSPGKSIELLDGERTKHTFIITESTDLPKKELKKDMTVEVQAIDVVAAAIEILSM